MVNAEWKERENAEKLVRLLLHYLDGLDNSGYSIDGENQMMLHDKANLEDVGKRRTESGMVFTYLSKQLDT